MAAISSSQIDRLGQRLKTGKLSEADLRLLDEYRRSFQLPYAHVENALRRLGLQVTGRPAKSTTSVIEKLRRESIRLTQMQDIAGCRVVVADVSEQERICASIRTLLSNTRVVDRRRTPSFGYRAVHVMVTHDSKAIEIQLRTELEHQWAELSEKASDVVAHDLKYGGGPAEVRYVLDRLSDQVGEAEEVERALIETLARIELPVEQLSPATQAHLAHLKDRISADREQVVELLKKIDALFSSMERSP